MDKYEYNLKLDQMKSLFAEEKYDEAADIADTINWNKVKNVNGLVKAGEVYEKVQRYEESRDILLMAYDRSPIGRMIIYRLAEVSVRMKDFDAAQDYYNEFVEIAPHDTLKYVLRYDIRKAQGAEADELIAILEELKDQEYTEEWAYELAYLYHKAGRSEKCIDACDELILWFGDGPYVERALELKMLYQPLSKAQEEKYRSFRQTKDEKRGLTHIDVEEMARAGEIAHEPVEIPKVEVHPERFNTVNLQEEIAKGMQQIINATEKETVTDTMDNINRMVGDIPYLKLPKENEAAEEDAPHIETDEEIDGSLRLNFQEMLGEEADGQISMVTDDKAMVERQITGQITIEEVLQEWEKTKRAAEAALEEAKQRKLESAKARALQEAETIMDRLTGALPKLDAGMTPRELLEEEYLQGDSAQEQPQTVPVTRIAADEPAQEQPDTADLAPETAGQPDTADIALANVPTEEAAENLQAAEAEPETEEADGPEVLQETPSDAGTEETAEELWPEGMSLEDMVRAQAAKSEPETEEAAEAPSGTGTEEAGPAFAESEPEAEPELAEEEAEAADEPETEPDFEEVAMADLPEKPTLAQEKEEEFSFVRRRERPSWKGKTTRVPQIDEPVDLGRDDADAQELLKLTDEQKAVFSYFMPVKGMETQLCRALTAATAHIKEDATAAAGNLVIQGGQGSGKTTLATSVIKVLQQETGALDGRIGKIHAEALNQKDVGTLLDKVAGGCLIIEQAGDMDDATVAELAVQLEQNTTGLFVILEDTSKGIKRLFAANERFAKQFGEQISVPIFTNDELVTFARSYSRELGYKIDDMAVLALYNRISNIQRLDQATTLTEVKEIVDEAIDREAHGGLRKAISILTASRYTDDDRIVLTEKDFQ